MYRLMSDICQMTVFIEVTYTSGLQLQFIYSVLHRVKKALFHCQQYVVHLYKELEGKHRALEYQHHKRTLKYFQQSIIHSTK